MKYEKLKMLFLGGMLSFSCGSSQAAKENDLWDGLYLQTDSGKNIEFKHSRGQTESRRTRNDERISCMTYNPNEDFNLIKEISAKEVRTVFFKPTAKYAAQMYELMQVEVKSRGSDYETKYCYNENDLFPKSRNFSGGTQLQVLPRLQAGKFYLIEKDFNTRSALIKFKK